MKARILVIEDDEAILAFLKRGLSYDGYEVETAEDGQKGLALAQGNLPDLVVLDLMLPGMDGLEVCRRLRAAGKVPILMLTAKDSVSAYACALCQSTLGQCLNGELAFMAGTVFAHTCAPAAERAETFLTQTTYSVWNPGDLHPKAAVACV